MAPFPSPTIVGLDDFMGKFYQMFKEQIIPTS